MSKTGQREYLSSKISASAWGRVGGRSRSGVVIPLFSVYSKESVGIGEFEDLKIAIDWASDCGNSIIQLLPLNEFGPTCCPYDSLSSFALEPSYLSIRLISSGLKTVQKKLEGLKSAYPLKGGRVDYRIKCEKIKVLREIFEQEDLGSAGEFMSFREANAYWLDDFCLYMALKQHFGFKAWYEWPEEYRDYRQEPLERFYQEHKEEILFRAWIQWQLFRQLTAVKQYAGSRNVWIKGDLPILVSRDSADVWAHPEFFKLDYAAGAPPDMYCSRGQRWGVPTYNWEAIASDGYTYLKEKLKYAENFYDLLRIDHVVGLFRIWSIPYSEPAETLGLNGFFDPRDEGLWGEHGRSILSVIMGNTKMLLCAEDLGSIPKVCTDTLADLGIPGNDVQRWVKDWNVRHDFLKPGEYRDLAVAMLSTHDTTNWPAWWENEAGTVDEALFVRRCRERGIDYGSVSIRLFDRSLSGHARLRWLASVDSVDTLVSILGKPASEVGDFVEMYLNSFAEKEKLWKLLGMPGKMQEKCSVELLRAALKFTLESRSVFCIQLITDWLALAGFFQDDPYRYRINTPGTVGPGNWSMVMPVPLEELLDHPVTASIREMVRASGRL